MHKHAHIYTYTYTWHDCSRENACSKSLYRLPRARACVFSSWPRDELLLSITVYQYYSFRIRKIRDCRKKDRQTYYGRLVIGTARRNDTFEAVKSGTYYDGATWIFSQCDLSLDDAYIWFCFFIKMQFFFKAYVNKIQNYALYPTLYIFMRHHANWTYNYTRYSSRFYF